MDIDLSKVIGYSRDSLQSRALMRSIMLDLYPGKTREMNVLLDVYESGVPRKIKNDGNITDAKYAQYIQKIVDDYGMQEQWAVVGLNAWIDVCLGKGTAERIKFNSTVVPSVPTRVPVANGGGVVNSPTQPAMAVNGVASDYELIQLNGNAVQIKKYVGFDKADTVVPNVIEGKRVLSIGDQAYSNCAGIHTLVVSEGIESIGNNAFNDCKGLSSVKLPTTLTYIGSRAFSSTAISSIDLPNGIKKISDSTFSFCRNLTKVTLPDYLESIERGAFDYTGLTSIALPNSVRSIGNDAFKECGKLLSVSLNEGLIEIGGGAFEKCGSLRTILIPSTVVKFGSNIFGESIIRTPDIVVECYLGTKAIEYARNHKLSIRNAATNIKAQDTVSVAPAKDIEHITIERKEPKIGNPSNYELRDLGNNCVELVKYVGFDETNTVVPNTINGKNVVSIGSNAYSNCLGMQSLVISEGIENIGDGAFNSCSNLRTVKLPTSLRKIGPRAFSSTAISSVDLPNGIKKIENSTFSFCRNLSQVILPDYLEEIEQGAFDYTGIVSINLPSSVRSIGGSAFKECSKLVSINLNEGLQEIGGGAFEKCGSLKNILMPKSLVKFGSNIFGESIIRTPDITVRCYIGSKAIEYARNHKLKIENAGA